MVRGAHLAAGLGAGFTGLRALLAMVHVVLAAFRSAGIADLRAQFAQAMGIAVRVRIRTRHEGRCHAADVRTIAVFVDHLLEAAHLPLDSAKSLEIAVANIRIDPHCLTTGRVLDGTAAGAFNAGIFHSLHLPSRRLLATTLTELSAIAALARIGLRRIPVAG